MVFFFLTGSKQHGVNTVQWYNVQSKFAGDLAFALLPKTAARPLLLCNSQTSVSVWCSGQLSMSRPGEVWQAMHASELQCTENCTCLSSCKYRLTVGCLCQFSAEWHYFLSLRSNTLLWKVIECDPPCKRCYLILTLYKQPPSRSQVHPVETESNATCLLREFFLSIF